MSDEYLICNTTREQREKIVQACVGECGSCDGCAMGLGYDLYLPYIEGKKEIAEINADFRSRYIRKD